MTAPTKSRARAGVPELPLTGEVQTPTAGGAVMKPEPQGNGALRTVPDGSAASIYQMMQQAIDKGADVAALEKLVDLAERVTKREAALEFARALADFQAHCPPIGKVKTAEITTKSGGKYAYTYAPLEEIVRVVKPLLIARGFSYGWDSELQANVLKVTCTLRHVNGHSEPASFTLPTENASAMSPQQKVGAALTFAQRKTLESVLGLNTTEEDTDGIAREIDPTPITDDQLVALEDMVLETKTDLPRFLKFLGIEQLADLPAVRFREATAAIEQKKQQQKKGAQ